MENNSTISFITRHLGQVLVAALCILGISARAQVASTYQFSQENGSFSMITSGGSVLSSGTFDNTVHTVSLASPGVLFEGVEYNTMYVSTNGFITFGSAASNTNYTPISNSAGYSGAIAGFGARLENATSGTREVRVVRIGNELIVQWRDVRRRGVSGGERFSFQIRMNTSDGQIRIVYGPLASQNSGTDHQPQVGLRGPSNAFATNVNNRLVTSSSGSNWNNSSQGTANSSACRFTSGSNARSWPEGLTYVWTFCQSAQITGTTQSGPICSGQDLQLGVTAGGEGPFTYAWSGPGTFSPNSTSANVTVSGAQSGNYSVTVTGACGAASTNVAVTVNSLPTGVSATASAPSVCSLNNTVDLTGTSDLGGSSILVQEDFEGSGMPAGWQAFNQGSGGTVSAADWTLVQSPHNATYNTISSNDASQFFLSNSDLQGSGSTTNTMLQLPVLNTMGYSSLSLSFRHFYRRYQGTENANVEVSTDGSNWTSAAQYNADQGSQANFANANINLNAYTGQPTLHIRFRYYATWDYYWAMDNVTVSGTPIPATYVWSSDPAGFSSNALSPQGVAVGQATSYTLSVTDPGGCTASASVSVGHQQATTWYADTDEDGYGDLNDSIVACEQPDGYVANSDDDCPILPGVVGDTCDDNDPTTENDVVNAFCQCAGSTITLYSIASGTFTDGSIWSLTPGGPPAGVYPVGHDIVVSSGHSISVSGQQLVGDLTVQSGATLSFALSEVLLTVTGSTVVLDGEVSGGGVLSLDGQSATALTRTSGVLDITNLTIACPEGVTANGAFHVRGALELAAGNFDATNASITLRSTASATARLAPVAPGATYTGNLKMERQIPGGATNWRLLGSPVVGATVNDWKDDFYMAGFPGSHYPNFYSGGQLWPSVRRYDETMPSSDMNVGLVGVAGTSEQLQVGRGYANWSGDALGGTQAFVVDVTGPPVIATTPIQLPLTWSNSGNPNADGWNLVSNPLPSPIAFSAIARGADVENGYYIYNPATGTSGSWNAQFNVGTNGANGIIQSSQGFWMKANGPNVTTSVDESAKVASQTGGSFGGMLAGQLAMARLHLRNNNPAYADETVVLFDVGTSGFDDGDMERIDFGHSSAPRIATRADNTMLSINAAGQLNEALVVPVAVRATTNGSHSITITGVEALVGMSCVVLEDLVTGARIPVQEGSVHSFTMNSTSGNLVHRFNLHVSAAVRREVTEVSCHGEANGAVQVTLPGGSDELVTWSTTAGVTLGQQALSAGTTTISGLAAGNYIVAVGTAGECGAIQGDVVVVEPMPMEVQAALSMPDCHDSTEGGIVLDVLGGTAPYTYLWGNGATTDSLLAAPGEHQVVITDDRGCTLQNEYRISAPEPISATVSSTPPTCHGANDGVLTISAQGGSGNYSFAWVHGAQGAQLTVGEGAYTVSITDELGCVTQQEVQVSAPPALGMGVTVQPASCAGLADGVAEVTPAGGTAPYAYAWSTGQTTTQLVATAGTYNVLVTDANGCEVEQAVTINEVGPIEAELLLEVIGCGDAAQGTVMLQASGGSAPYTYLWSNGASGAQTTLASGVHQVTITDALGCQFVQAVDVPAPQQLSVQVNVQPVSCAGYADGLLSATVSGGVTPYHYAWDNGATDAMVNVHAGTHLLTVTDAAGCAVLVPAEMFAPDALALDVVTVPVTCAGAENGSATVLATGGVAPFSIAWSNGVTGEQFLGAAGNYAVVLTDANGCSLERTFTLVEPAPISMAVVVEAASCPSSNDGEATVTANGGEAPYQFLWSNGMEGSTVQIPGGQYEVVVRDAHGCETQQVVTVSSGPYPVAAIASMEPYVMVGEQVQFISLSTSAAGLLWEFGDGSTSTNIMPVHAFALPGTYSISLVAIQGLCSDTAATTLVVEASTGVDGVREQGEVRAWTTANAFHVWLPSSEGVVQAKLHDASGKLHRSNMVPVDRNQVELAADHLSSGVWFLTIETGSAQHSFRLLLTR